MSSPEAFESVDWLAFCVELLKRLDRIADELQNIGNRIAETTTTTEGEP